jgi:transposase-like protein
MKKFSEEEKKMWLEDWQASGKSAWRYAQDNGLNVQTLKNWTVPKQENKTTFVEIPAQILRTTGQTKELTIEKGEIKIRIPLELGQSELRTVKELLGQAL